MAEDPLETLISLFASLPGLGPRSARRAVLHMVKRRQSLMTTLAATLKQAAESLCFCRICHNLDTHDPCAVCTNTNRDVSLLCVVEDIADLWALERAGVFKGRYHVLGGVLSAIDGMGPEDLHIPDLIARARDESVREVVLATNATLDGQTTAHYIAECLAGSGVAISRLSQGLPVGGELDYLDEGTLTAALKTRRPL